MQELEKILEEIERVKEAIVNIDCGDDYNAGIKDMSMMAKQSVCKHMNDGWIPVKKFGLPHINEHDFRFWVTIQYTNGFRHTIKAKWDWFDKCFMHQNGKKISEDVVAYKYYSAPEPYRPERSDNHDGE